MTGGSDSDGRSAPDPLAFVVFGASGDLTKRLLVPALYNLAASRRLPDAFALIGVARSEYSTADFRRLLRESLETNASATINAAIAERLLGAASYVSGELDDPGTYERLARELRRLESGGRAVNCLFYLATPPGVFVPVARQLHQSGLSREEDGAWRRLIVEKPFGTDLVSAQQLNRDLLQVLAEHQIYRIDHYLGKETVQNIMIMRFANGMFEPIWNRDHVDHVQITVAEALDVGRRGRFYDATGALRDMVPNHLFQLLALTTMEPPARFEAEAVRSERTKVFEAVRIPSRTEALDSSVRAQYVAGDVRGRPIDAYVRTPGARPDSTTETYVALRLLIDNWRWAGVPIYLRTGKALAARRSEIAIKFKHAPFALFRGTEVDRLAQNFLVLRIQPDEGVTLHFNAKVPGPSLAIDGVGMTFKYKDYFEAVPSTGYETLILDCIIGERTLFQRADNVEAGWRVVQPFLDAWAGAGREGLATYAAGSGGPVEAATLAERDGRRWRSIE